MVSEGISQVLVPHRTDKLARKSGTSWTGQWTRCFTLSLGSAKRESTRHTFLFEHTSERCLSCWRPAVMLGLVGQSVCLLLPKSFQVLVHAHHTSM